MMLVILFAISFTVWLCALAHRSKSDGQDASNNECERTDGASQLTCHLYLLPKVRE
jgi:hypothetical protein